jgi:hypothetical protein
VTTAAHRSLADVLARPAERLCAFSAERPVRGWVVACTALLPVLLTAAWLIADVRQPGTYSPVRQTVSVLSGQAGTDRWIVTSALYLVGVGYLVAAYGLTAVGVAARVGLVVAGAAAIGVATFPEPAQGSSKPHALCTGIGAITIAVWPVLVARRDSLALGALGLRASVVASVVSVALFCWTALEIGGTALGLAERVSSSMQVAWPFVIALTLQRATGAQARDSARPQRTGHQQGADQRDHRTRPA